MEAGAPLDWQTTAPEMMRRTLASLLKTAVARQTSRTWSGRTNAESLASLAPSGETTEDGIRQGLRAPLVYCIYATRIADQDDCDLSVAPARHPGADARSRHPPSRQPLMPPGAMSASGHTRLRPARRRVSAARLSILLPGCEDCGHGTSAQCWAAAGSAMPDTGVLRWAP